jgi:hypothetical protein
MAFSYFIPPFLFNDKHNSQTNRDHNNKCKIYCQTLQIKKQDIIKTNLANATHIICYLCPELMAEIEKKIRKECAPKTKIISCDFKMPTIRPIKTISIKIDRSKRGQFMYIYET